MLSPTATFTMMMMPTDCGWRNHHHHDHHHFFFFVFFFYFFVFLPSSTFTSIEPTTLRPRPDHIFLSSQARPSSSHHIIVHLSMNFVGNWLLELIIENIYHCINIDDVLGSLLTRRDFQKYATTTFSRNWVRYDFGILSTESSVFLNSIPILALVLR